MQFTKLFKLIYIIITITSTSIDVEQVKLTVEKMDKNDDGRLSLVDLFLILGDVARKL